MNRQELFWLFRMKIFYNIIFLFLENCIYFVIYALYLSKASIFENTGREYTLYICNNIDHYSVNLLTAICIIICTTIQPDINPTPPLEFPSDGLHVRIIQAPEPYNLTKPPMFYFGNETITDGPINKLQEAIESKLNDGILKPSSLPINVIAKISENYTENYIENKYYNNHIDSWTSIALTLIVLIVLAVIVLVCSALCLKRVQNLKISKRQLLIEDCDDSVMKDLIHIQRV